MRDGIHRLTCALLEQGVFHCYFSLFIHSCCLTLRLLYYTYNATIVLEITALGQVRDERRRVAGFLTEGKSPQMLLKSSRMDELHEITHPGMDLSG